MDADIAVLRGDGVGPEIIDQALKVAGSVATRFGHQLTWSEGLIGHDAHMKTGHGLPRETLDLCLSSDAVLLGATGAPPEQPRPPSEIDGKNLRQHLELSCNLRTVKLLAGLVGVGPIRAEAKTKGVDFVIARDIAATGAYGPGGTEETAGGRRGRSTFTFTEQDVAGVIAPAFELARNRSGRIHLVGYWGIIGCSDIWRAVFDEVAVGHPDVECHYMLPDHCNMLVARDPHLFDVIVFDDLFRAGMVVDLGALLLGSLGMGPPSAMLRPDRHDDGTVNPSLHKVFGMYEPSHGCVPHRAGRDQVNPVATILSAADLFRYSLGLSTEADLIEAAIVDVVAAGYRTYDIMERDTILVGCAEMGDRIANAAATVEP